MHIDHPKLPAIPSVSVGKPWALVPTWNGWLMSTLEFWTSKNWPARLLSPTILDIKGLTCQMPQFSASVLSEPAKLMLPPWDIQDAPVVDISNTSST